MPPLRFYMLTICLCLCVGSSYAQLWSGAGWGLNIGVVSALGNRFQRLGLSVQAYYVQGHAQLAADVRAYHSFRNLGPAGQYNELVTSAGVLVGYGARTADYNELLSPVTNHTRYKTSLGYAYNLYFNKIKTTQQTGTISFQFGKVSVVAENDIFARPTLDRFRTGAFLLLYQYSPQCQLAINCTMWTGQLGNKVTSDTTFPYSAYMDTTLGVYTSYSHGLLSGQVKVATRYGQTAQASAGIDAEQVRNFVQNRLIHDMIFIPRNWNRRNNNAHMPMLDTAGQQYLYRPGQQVRPVHPYCNLFTGPALFY